MRVYKGDPIKLAGNSPVLSAALLQYVEQRYGLRTEQAVKLGGSWNLNVLVDGHVVRVYGPWVSVERLQALQEIRLILKSKGIPIAELRSTRDGATSSTFEDCVMEVERFVDGTPMKTWSQLMIGMQALGQIHTLMADLSSAVPEPVANHLPEDLAWPATEEVLQITQAWQPAANEAETRYIKAVESLARMLPVLHLPVQLVHGDFKDNNLVFHNKSLLAVLDFDFMGIRPRIDDLALPLHMLLQQGESLERIRRLVEAYDAGCDTPLSDQERHGLPYAMARMSLSYLQYMTIPGDEAYKVGRRQEFNERHGPACAWWLKKLVDYDFRERGFL